MTVETLFAAALEKSDPADRRAFLDAACAGNVGLRRRVERLLAADEHASDTLSRGAAVATGSPSLSPLTAGDVLAGRFKLRQLLGTGGMGEVWVADQVDPVQRRIALKLIRPGLASAGLVARFDQERQALARMDHPGIARVLDAGTTETGRPYFVMELIKGVPITEYCDTAKLSSRERLDLFVPVCQAVQHAHQKGIIHRDLKPSNILVALYDGEPVVKVIDFGIAKATGERLSEQSVYTEVGTLVGTLEYMSPEQAELNNLDIDTRSDVYSLGVVLYELLTGSVPHSREGLRSVPFVEMLRIIKEVDPPRPSTRLASDTETLPAVAAARQTEPKKLTAFVRGELDLIVMKCLEKDRNRRYETASSFASDLQRYLTGESVLAVPPSVGYRLGKFVKRNKGRVLAAGLVLVALVAGIAGTTWGMIRANQAHRDAVGAQSAEADRAEGERKAKEEVQKRLAQLETGTEILASMFRDLDPKAEQKEGVTLRVLLGRRLGEAVRQLEGEAVGDPLVVARLQHTLGISLRELGHLEQAEVVLVQALRTRESLLGNNNLDTAATKHNLASLYWALKKHAQAEALYKEVLEVRVSQLAPDHADTLSTKNNLGLVYLSQSKLTLAEPLLQEVVAKRIANLKDDDPKTLQSKNNLAGLFDLQGKYTESEKLLEEVLAARTRTLRAGHPDLLQSKNNLAHIYLTQKKFSQAETLLEEVVEEFAAEMGPGNALTLTSKSNLAAAYLDQKKYAKAESLLKAVLDARTAKLEADHPDTLYSKNAVGVVYLYQGKFALAEALLKEVLAAHSIKLEADHPEVLNSKNNLARLYVKMNREPEAEQLFEEAVAGAKTRFRLSHDKTQDYIDGLADVHEKRGKPGASESNLRELADEIRKTAGDESPAYAARLGRLARNILAQGNYREAESVVRECLAIRSAKEPDNWTTFETRLLLGESLLGQSQFADAVPLLVQGYEGMKRLEAKRSPDGQRRLTATLERLVKLYEASDMPTEAAKWRAELEKADKSR